ncbi:short-chain fatty acid transporter [Bacillus andreraoultii]|uniref:short-chain fatty acid transporter n=1 Tax=Bacillus andreraoultii TaxID=1499685 RepID=UPI00053B0E4F|nr:short-chain fatty acid transporter [Bacillus andreraoultii]
MTSFFDRMVRRFLPDAFLFAIILTFIVFLLGIIFTDHSPIQMAEYWGTGFWDLLAFTMQMTLIVVTGYVLASSPLVRNLLINLSNLATTPNQAVVLVTVVSTIGCLINYGFGMVVGALLATHVIKKVPTVDYRLLVASAYSGFLVWHGGLSGSIPLTIATEGHFLQDILGVIPITKTLLSPYNLFIVIALLITLPILNRLLLKSGTSVNDIQPPGVDENTYGELEQASGEKTFATRMENSWVLSTLIGVMGLVFIVYYFIKNGLDLNINIVNFIFLFLGIIFHKTPRRFLESVNRAVKNASGIIVQFPFYAGIMGMMVASGLSAKLSEWFVSVSNEFMYPLLTFISAGILNIFVPSGGGQWAVQGPIMIPGAEALGVDLAKTAMAVAWGDAWTNMIQPFWAIPLLAIAGLKVRDIMGFCVTILLWSFIPIAIGLLFF